MCGGEGCGTSPIPFPGLDAGSSAAVGACKKIEAGGVEHSDGAIVVFDGGLRSVDTGLWAFVTWQ